MREFLEDAHAHRDDGYGRAQAAMKKELPKRFYKVAAFEAIAGGFAVTLDGKTTKTPNQKPICVPTSGLAEAMVGEWDAQKTHIDPSGMPIVRLVNAAMEGGAETKPDLIAEIAKYAGNDLLLYRADSPQELVEAQEQAWDAILVEMARHFGVVFQPTVGIIHQPQDPEMLEKMAAAVADEDFLALTALTSITSLSGSGLLAIALREGLITPDQLWTAAHVDEDYNAKLWGADVEAQAQRAKRRVEFDAAVTCLALLPR
jgi:chaperone required for assembly of F1-ATPase